MDNYILGGGIVGLVTAFYNPSFKVISKEVGGQMASGVPMGPRILEANSNSYKLLSDLGMDLVLKTAKIGYWVDGKIVDKCPNKLRGTYYMKSRGLQAEDVAMIPSSIMSDGKNEIYYYDINWDDMLGRLKSRIGHKRMIDGKINAIDVVNQRLLVETAPLLEIEMEYDRLISTIPAPMFHSMAMVEPERYFHYLPKQFVILNQHLALQDHPEYDYIYCPCEEQDFHRMTRFPDDIVCVEYTTPYDSSVWAKDWENDKYSKVITHKNLKIGQIVAGKPRKIDNVYYVGRYAAWDHDLKTDDVVEQAQFLHATLGV